MVLPDDVVVQRKLLPVKTARHIAITALLLLAGCRHTEPRFGDDGTLPNVTLGELRQYLDGSELTLADDIVVSGRVVSSDLAGNFYNTFFIDDGTGAAEIMAGMPDLHATYRTGQRVVIRAKGLAVGWREGAMQLGLPPEAGSGFATGYFYHPAVIRRYVGRRRDVAEVEPTPTEIAALTPEMCGRLVTIGGLHPDPDEESESWASSAAQSQKGYRKFYTAGRADSLTVVTSGYASFADRPLPTGETTLTGIVLYGKGGSSKDHFLLKLRDEKDIGR